LKTETISYQHSSVFYRQFGTGNKKLFCLHGYGEDSETFVFLEPFLGKDFTLIAFDLPFHAKTEWNEKILFTIEDWVKIINRFIDKNELIYLLGYSMGGRLALHLLEIIPERICCVKLIAPDGLHRNFWYYFSTQTFIGNKLFAYTVKHPAWFLTLIKFSGSIKLINQNLFNFSFQFMNDKTSRVLLYKRWTAFKKIKPNLFHLKKIIQQNSIHVNMLFGKFDKIILTKDGIKFRKGTENKVFVTEIEAGHQLLRSKYADEIVKLFNS
jgi:Predicted hydrolases or acyltransferases (alpha/beta hydrolase superfamily)